MKTMNYYTNKIIEMSFTPLLSFSRKRESRRRLRELWGLKSWIPCQARNDRREHIYTTERGFTLIELVMTMVLIGVIAYIVASAMATGFKAYFTTDFRKEALDQARIAIERMTREIRNVRSSADITTANATTFTFTDVSGTAISFALNAGNINRTSGATNTLAAGISSASIFTYVLSTGATTQSPSPAEILLIKRVKIDITATKNAESVTLQSEVWPRSL